MAEGARMISESEKSALAEGVRNFVFYKTYRLRDIQLLEVKLDEESEDLRSFLSLVTRVDVSYKCDGDTEEHRGSFIVKRVPGDGFQSRIVKSCRAFEREIAFYRVFSPVVDKIVGIMTIDDKRVENLRGIIPEFLFPNKGDGGSSEFIILDDLGARGYRLPRCESKVQGLDLDHCLIAVRGLGRFHALAEGVGGFFDSRPLFRFLSLDFSPLVYSCMDALYRTIRCLKRHRWLYGAASWIENLFPSSLVKASRGIPRNIPELGRDALFYPSEREEEPSIFLDVVRRRAEVVLYIARRLGGLPRKAAESGFLGRELEKVWSILIRSASASRSGWNVINHGDCWINNMLFKYDEDCVKPVDTILIDFQCSRYCPPAIDILIFLYTSTHRSFRELHFDLLVSKYYESFLETRFTLSPISISLEDLKADLRGQYEPFGVIIGTFFAPYLKVETEDNVSQDAFEAFVRDGNSSAAILQFNRDPEFRSFMEENVRELTEVIFPCGDLGHVNQYWAYICFPPKLQKPCVTPLEISPALLKPVCFEWYSNFRDMDSPSSLIQREHLLHAIETVEGRTDIQLLEDVEVKRATAGVEGFLSLVLRVRASYKVGDDPEIRSKTMFVKCLPKDEFQLNIVKMTNVFVREGVFYDKALPLLNKAAAGKVDVSIPRCYHASYGGTADTIYLEDLAESDYTTVGKRQVAKGLDWEHARLLAKKMGLFHALGIAAEKFLPEGKKSWSDAFSVFGEEPLYYEQKPGDPLVPFKGLADTGNEIVVEVAKTMTGVAKEAADTGKLQCIIDRIWPIVCKLLQPNQAGHNVLSHGDCWVNNVMFRYEVNDQGTKIPVNLKFIDMQNVKYCHPSIDLLYLIHLSTRKSFRNKYYDDVIAEYFSSLEETLETVDFGPPPFTLEEFSRELKEIYIVCAVYLAAVYSPCMLLEEEFTPDNAEDMTPEKYEELINFGNVKAVRKKLASDPTYLSHVQDVVQEFVDVVFPDGSVDTSPYLP
ncbi:uncharacterized protein LOC124167634 [Ischnura elegans]|uniref:uncharacterized protein LOC124167634 n=1 Tax=Ischnura elegans TaxID=197161 RepID=UPI001ED8A4E2|nr:uncharacterized protein LOC124167634 [Ischnura elegans]